MATIVTDLYAGRRAEKQAGLEMASRGLESFSQILFQHHIAVQREKAQETNTLLTALDELGPEAVGQKGLAKLEANMGGQFPRNTQGEIVLPDSPSRMMKVQQARKFKMDVDAMDAALKSGDQHTILKLQGLESPAPDPVAVDLENKKIDARKEEADADRAAHTRDTLINAGASKYSADQHYAAVMAGIDAKPENQFSGMYRYRGKLRDDAIAARKGVPQTRGDVKFWQGAKSKQLRDLQTRANIGLISMRGQKIAKDLAALSGTSKATRDLLANAAAQEKGGNKDVAAALREAAVRPLVEKDSELMAELANMKDAKNAPGPFSAEGISLVWDSIFNSAQAERLDSNLNAGTTEGTTKSGIPYRVREK